MSGLSYGEMIAKLTLEDTDDKPAMLTIRSVRVQNMAPAGKPEENKLVICFAEEFDGETPDKKRREYIVNATSYKTLCTKYGTSDHNKWAGKPIVMAPTKTEYGNETFEKPHVATPDRWDKVVAAASKASKPAAKRAR